MSIIGAGKNSTIINLADGVGGSGYGAISCLTANSKFFRVSGIRFNFANSISSLQYVRLSMQAQGRRLLLLRRVHN
jgi:hypothetical protein